MKAYLLFLVLYFLNLIAKTSEQLEKEAIQ